MKKEKQIIFESDDLINAETRKILKELSQIMKEDKMQMLAERKRWVEDMEAERKRWVEEMEAERKQRKESQNDFMKRMDRLDYLFGQTREQIGGISKSNGEFCEEYFINCFKENPTLFGEKYDRVLEYYKPEPVVINDEYDLILRNGSTVALIEMKYKASTHDVGKMFSKLMTYRTNFPMYKNHKTYLCLASFRFPKAVRIKAKEDGIVLIEQRGEKIEVISENLKTW
jgi:hypothetical protein